jgi:parallel beta-helix repeat protein
MLNNSIANYSPNIVENSKGEINSELKLTGYWEIGPIEIDDDDPTKNWLITAATYDWCSGSGSWNDPFILENITIDTQFSSTAITIRNSEVFFQLRNCTIYNISSSYVGIRLEYVDNGFIKNNNINNEIGSATGISIGLSDCSNNTIIENSMISRGNSGIMIDGGSQNNIVNNTCLQYGIVCVNSDYNLIKGNIIDNMKIGGWGISFGEFCDFNNIISNKIMNSSQNGITLFRGSNFNNISKNILIDNNEKAIDCSTNIGSCWNNKVHNNFMYNNGYGIYLDYFYNSSFSNNIIVNSSLYGVYVNIGQNNIFSNNTFINNTINAYDDSVDNFWDYNSLGNHWDDYGGVDANDNGIGDTPYDVPPIGGSMDNYPIWEDGDDLAPDIIIISPAMNDVFGINAPNFTITINDASPINTTWYTIDDGVNNYFFSGLSGMINQTAWDDKGTETIMTLRFYANDSLGHLGFEDVIIWKDLVDPQININSPVPDEWCGVDAPLFSLIINEPNILVKQYSINGRPNITFTTEQQFSQSEWDNIGNGTVSIIFYVIDKADNINSDEVAVRKDAYIPDITIHLPIQDEVFKRTAPAFNISIVEEHFISAWYTIEGSVPYPISGYVGTINQDAWDSLPEGDVIIIFYVTDKAGNIGFKSVTVIKRIPAPPAIPGFNLFLLLSTISVVIILLRKKVKKSRRKLDEKCK